MVGAIIVFLGVLALVFLYMWIVHRFLVSAEEPEDRVRETKSGGSVKASASLPPCSREAQWAR